MMIRSLKRLPAGGLFIGPLFLRSVYIEIFDVSPLCPAAELVGWERCCAMALIKNMDLITLEDNCIKTQYF